jgi:uncharacterized protein (TIGR03067 family)
MRWQLVGILSYLVFVQTSPAFADDIRTFVGTWKGLEKREPRELRIEPDGEQTAKGKFTLTWLFGEPEKGNIEIDASKSPHEITLTGADQKLRKGIYTIDTVGGKARLKIYISKPGGERPSTLEKNPPKVEEWIVEKS